MLLASLFMLYCSLLFLTKPVTGLARLTRRFWHSGQLIVLDGPYHILRKNIQKISVPSKLLKHFRSGLRREF